MEKKSETISVRLTKRDKDDLIRFAKDDQRPPSQLVAIIVRKWLEAKRRK